METASRKKLKNITAFKYTVVFEYFKNRSIHLLLAIIISSLCKKCYTSD